MSLIVVVVSFAVFWFWSLGVFNGLIYGINHKGMSVTSDCLKPWNPQNTQNPNGAIGHKSGNPQIDAGLFQIVV